MGSSHSSRPCYRLLNHNLPPPFMKAHMVPFLNSNKKARWMIISSSLKDSPIKLLVSHRREVQALQAISLPQVVALAKLQEKKLQDRRRPSRPPQSPFLRSPVGLPPLPFFPPSPQTTFGGGIGHSSRQGFVLPLWREMGSRSQVSTATSSLYCRWWRWLDYLHPLIRAQSFNIRNLRVCLKSASTCYRGCLRLRLFACMVLSPTTSSWFSSMMVVHIISSRSRITAFLHLDATSMAMMHVMIGNGRTLNYDTKCPLVPEPSSSPIR